eukprot:TRINITY_DN5636_c0_g4_i6.p2 TRINITY_DN5636_c0_g4~~TRINITY_DN5636_c0_g4_i6.p2  ORF type:complete len:112 (+),score=2.25 TRINITY_DN5636_c0_g4_i6:193-528(+)
MVSSNGYTEYSLDFPNMFPKIFLLFVKSRYEICWYEKSGTGSCSLNLLNSLYVVCKQPEGVYKWEYMVSYFFHKYNQNIQSNRFYFKFCLKYDCCLHLFIGACQIFQCLVY